MGWKIFAVVNFGLFIMGTSYPNRDFFDAIGIAIGFAVSTGVILYAFNKRALPEHFWQWVSWALVPWFLISCSLMILRTLPSLKVSATSIFALLVAVVVTGGISYFEWVAVRRLFKGIPNPAR